MKFHQALASVLGIGMVKGGGTVAAMLFCIIWFFLPAGYETGSWQVIITVMIIVTGIWSSNHVEITWGKDSSKVVIDEVAGMAIALLFVPKGLVYLAASLAAFRFFDIVKPLGVRRMEQLPGGWGVMGDDVLAGLYALATVQAGRWLTQSIQLT